jgi:hypothetical protein
MKRRVKMFRAGHLPLGTPTPADGSRPTARSLVAKFFRLRNLASTLDFTALPKGLEPLVSP